MELIQIFEKAPYPQRMARELLDQVLAKWRVSARRYRLHLELSRFRAKRYGTATEVEAIEEQIDKHCSLDRLPKVWHLDYFFSAEGFFYYGPKIFTYWSLVLFHFCSQAEGWTEDQLSFSVKQPAIKDPYRLPGFRPVSRVWSTGWLEEFHLAWRTELHDVYYLP